MDSDDTYHPHFLECLYHEIEHSSADLVFCGYDKCFKNQTVPYTHTWKYPLHHNISSLKCDILTGKTHICHCAVLFRRSFLDAKNIYYTDSCRHAGDTEFIYKILFLNPEFSYVNQSLYYYNIHQNSISTRTPTEENFDAFYAYERIKEAIKNPFWKALFVLTRESREVFHILENFADHNLQMPYLFCSLGKIFSLLLVNAFVRRNSASRQMVKYFWNHYIKTG